MIFVDMDGVLVDFFSGACDLFNLDEKLAKPDGDRLEKFCDIPNEKFWEKIERQGINWWEDLSPYVWATKLIEMCESFDNTYVVSSPSLCCSAATGKLLWLKEHFPAIFTEKRFFLGSNKYLLSKRERLLIDDGHRNCSLFIGHGGESILFPQPWNRKYVCETFRDMNIEKIYKDNFIAKKIASFILDKIDP